MEVGALWSKSWDACPKQGYWKGWKLVAFYPDAKEQKVYEVWNELGTENFYHKSWRMVKVIKGGEEVWEVQASKVIDYGNDILLVHEEWKRML